MSVQNEPDEAPIDWTKLAVLAFMAVVVFWTSLAAAGLVLRTGAFEPAPGDDRVLHLWQVDGSPWRHHETERTVGTGAVSADRTRHLVAAESPPAAERPVRKTTR